MNTFIFSVHAKKRLLMVDRSVQERIKRKLRSLKSHEDIMSVLKALHGLEPATHRLRIGDYRLILQHREGSQFLVIDVGHRSRIYR